MVASLPDPEALVEALAGQMRGKLARDAALVGIYTGGVWVAERLHRALGLAVRRWARSTSPSTATISGASACTARRGAARLPFSVEGREIVLVDDVLHTGRTIRAAMNELFDYGRPRAVRLASWSTAAGASCRSAADFAGRAGRRGAPTRNSVLSNDETAAAPDRVNDRPA